MSTLSNYANLSASRTFARLLAIATITLGLGACNSFDPNLGATPFRCGTDSPRCPDNYTCVTYSADDEVCEANNAGVDRADTGPVGDGDPAGLVCNNDSEVEPNNSIEGATRVTIPATTPFRLAQLAICPTGDQDFFQFDITVNGADVVVEIEHMSNRGVLGLELLKGDGSILSTGSAVAGNPDLVRVAIPNIAQDTYIARVFPSETGIQNNYVFEISVGQ